MASAGLPSARRRWPRRWALAALAVTLAGAGCHRSSLAVPAASAPPAGGQREALLVEFRAIAEAAAAGDDPYLGRIALETLEARLPAVAGSGGELRTRLALGFEYLKHGRTGDAVREFEAGVAIAGDSPAGREDRKKALRHLALAYLRQGEDRNCLAQHRAESCIFPLRGGGVHIDRGPAERAIATYLAYLELHPDSIATRWMLNLAAMQAGVYPAGVPGHLVIPDRLLASTLEFPRFANVAPRLGLHAMNLAGGAVIEDLNRDGFLDLVFSNSDPAGPLALFLASGDGTYRDASRESGLDAQWGGLNVMQTDYDNDGSPDLFITRGGWHGAYGRWRTSLLRNQGDGTFRDVTREAGLAEPAYPTQAAAWGDYDNDGDLDVYIGNEADSYVARATPYPSQLFRNNGDGTFRDVAAEAGVENRRIAKGVAWGDYDGDGDLDLYVSNLGPNRLYRNRGDGHFDDVAPALAVTEPVGRSFACWFFDVDNDGDLDIFVAGYHADTASVAASLLGDAGAPGERPRLYRNRGDGSFENAAPAFGLGGVYLAMGANHGDIDNDGFPDIYLGTGDPSYESLVPNVMFLNQGGERFVDVTTAGGFGHLQKGHGIAFGDLDNDGDQDVVAEMGGFYPGDRAVSAVFENPGSGRRWLALSLHGVRSNRAGFGARIEVVIAEPGGSRSIHVVGGTGGSFGASSLLQEIGLGDALRIEMLEVKWPTSGLVQRFADVAMDRSYEVREGEAELRPLARKRVVLGGQR